MKSYKQEFPLTFPYLGVRAVRERARHLGTPHFRRLLCGPKLVALGLIPNTETFPFLFLTTY